MSGAYYTTEDGITYEAYEASEYDMVSDSLQAFESYAAMVEGGLDEQEEESLDLAAELLTFE